MYWTGAINNWASPSSEDEPHHIFFQASFSPAVNVAKVVRMLMFHQFLMEVCDEHCSL